MSSTLSFNLVREPWIPVTMLDGTTAELGLMDFFAQAHEARGLNEPSPLTYTAMMRYLIAILHRATDGPEDPVDWAERWQHGHFDTDEILSYLERWEHRFDLFDPEQPFAQEGPTFVQKESSPVTRLYPERTSGNNPTLFDHAWDNAAISVSAAEAARALLAAHGYAFAGAGGKFYNSTLIAGYIILFEGSNLFETLMFNLQEYTDDSPENLGKHGNRDKPWWELDADPIARPGGNLPQGLTDLLTWRARSIRLIPESDLSVREIFYAQRYQLRDEGILDPFKRYTRILTGPQKGQLSPKNFVPGKALWRDSFALIEQGNEDDEDSTLRNPVPGIVNWVATSATELQTYHGYDHLTPTLIATGLINDKAKIDLWRMDRLPLPVRVMTERNLRIQVRDAIARAEDVRNALNQAGTRFATEALSLGERSPDPKDVGRERANLKLDERYWSRLDTPFQRFIIALGDSDTTLDADQLSPAVRTWYRDLRDIARTVYIEATNSAGLDSRWFRAQAYGARVLDSQLKKALGDSLDQPEDSPTNDITEDPIA